MTPAPKGLSARSRALWAALLERDDYSPHEQETLRRALEWLDRSDALWREAEETADPKLRLQRIKAAHDAAMAAVRFWKALKFEKAGAAPVRPGRPAGQHWSALRKTATDIRGKVIADA